MRDPVIWRDYARGWLDSRCPICHSVEDFYRTFSAKTANGRYLVTCGSHYCRAKAGERV